MPPTKNWNHFLFFQCTNCKTSTIGHICLACQIYQGSSRQERTQSSSVSQSGILPDCFPEIPHAVYLESNIPMIVFHRLNNKSQKMSAAMETCGSNRLLFVKEAFSSNHEVSSVGHWILSCFVPWTWSADSCFLIFDTNSKFTVLATRGTLK